MLINFRVESAAIAGAKELINFENTLRILLSQMVAELRRRDILQDGTALNFSVSKGKKDYLLSLSCSQRTTGARNAISIVTQSGQKRTDSSITSAS